MGGRSTHPSPRKTVPVLVALVPLLLLSSGLSLPTRSDPGIEANTSNQPQNGSVPSASLTSTYSSLVNYTDVLVIRNLNSADSMTIADYFRLQRNISWAHVCNVTTSPNEQIDGTSFTALASQVESCINALPPGDTINYLVTTKGVPLGTYRSPWTSSASVDSELALVGGRYKSRIGMDQWFTDPYFKKFQPFSYSAYGFRIVTRLTAYTVPEAIGLIDKATEAIGHRGNYVLDVDPGKDGGGYQVGNDWMRGAATILTARGFNVTLDQTYAFLSNYSGVAGYDSWGSNDGAWYTPVNSNSGFETDADTNGVPDGWFYDDSAGTANITLNSTVKESGSRSLEIQRPAIDGNYTAISENFSTLPESRYFLMGSVNLSDGVAGRGLFLQIKALDSSDNVLWAKNGSAVTGRFDWSGMPQVIYEPVPGATRLRVSVIFAQANGTAFVDDIRLIEIRPHNRWIQGSLAETAVSTGGRTFNYGTGYGQSLVADLIRDGVTGVKGYVYEPYLYAIAHGDILFDAYTRGYTLAESYMMASEWGLSWMDAIIGDPKLAPFNRSYIPDLSVLPDDIAFSNPRPDPGDVVDFSANIHNLGHFPAVNASVSFYLGDPRSGGTLLDTRRVSVMDNSTAVTSIPFHTTGLSGWYQLCVLVDSPNEFYESDETNNIACSALGVATTYTLHLMPGRRFISFPLLPVNETLESVLSSISGCYDYVRHYSAINRTNPWTSYASGRTYNSLQSLDNMMGFWINVTTPCDLVVHGVRPSSTTINLRAGWNMIGFPSFNASFTVADLKAGLGVPSAAVEAFDASAAPYYLRRAPDSYVLRTGEAYWVFAPSDCVLVLAA